MLLEQNIEFTTREVLYAKISKDPANLRFQGLSDEVPENDVRIATVRNHAHIGIQKLFFVDGSTFQHYLTTGNVPLMRVEDQACLMLVTPLPDNLHELDTESDKFWDKWVSSIR